MATTKATELSQLSSALQVDESTGEIIFTGSLSVDSNTLFIDSDSNRVGIGTLTPGSALEVSGDVSVSGTVDGRNVSSDGSKLDTIESNADVTDTANVTSAGALMDSELTNESAIKTLNQTVSTNSNVEFNSLNVDGGALFVDSVNNRVGIGTSSPSEALHVRTSETGSGVIIESTNDPTLSFSDDGVINYSFYHQNFNNSLLLRNTSGDVIVEYFQDGQTRFYINNSEAARIDSFGRLLVGTTDANVFNKTSGEGVAINGDHIQIARDSAPPLTLNRQGSDGSILGLNRNGSQVGDIRADSNNLGITSNDSRDIVFSPNFSEAMRLTSDRELFLGTYKAGNAQTNNQRFFIKSAPFNWGGSNTDEVAAISLGATVPSQDDGAITFETAVNINTGGVLTERMRINQFGNVGIGTTSPLEKLEVNGNIIADGVYLGGTGGAKKLDDYEEGTWTPTEKNGGTIQTRSSSSDASTYIKVGRLVFVRARLDFSNLPTDSLSLAIGGLPFTIRGGGNYGGSGEINYTSSADTRDWRVNFQESEDYIYFHTTNGYSDRVSNGDAVAVGLGDMIIGGVYETDS